MELCYYPFGMLMPSRKYEAQSGYRYGVGGKEKDNEIKGEGNSIDYGDRMLDTRFGRWLSLDPLQAKYPNQSPYNFCLNNPILFVDPDGREVVWTGFGGHYGKLIRALVKTESYKSVFVRAIKNQDNIFIKPVPSTDFYGYGDPIRKTNGYNIEIGGNGFIASDGSLTVDPTFMAKVIIHEGLHIRYGMAKDEGKQGDYPTLDRHMKIQDAGTTPNSAGTPEGYHGEHEAMAEGNIKLFVDGMKSFDANYGTQHSNDWYNAMAWRGSLSAKANGFNSLDAATKTKYQNLIDNEDKYESYLSAKATYKSNKTAANKAAMNTAKSAVDWKMYKKSRTK